MFGGFGPPALVHNSNLAVLVVFGCQQGSIGGEWRKSGLPYTGWGWEGCMGVLECSPGYGSELVVHGS